MTRKVINCSYRFYSTGLIQMSKSFTGQSEHGESTLNIDAHSAKTKDIISRVAELHDANFHYLTVLILHLTLSPTPIAELPCARCYRDVILKFRDIASLMEELCDGK